MAEDATAVPGGAPDSPPSPEPTLVKWTERIGGTLLALIALLFGSDVHVSLGFAIYTEQALAGILACALAIIFVRYPARRGDLRTHVPWYDIVFAAAGAAFGLYLTLEYGGLAEDFFYRRTEAFVIGLVILPLTLEALRRTAGLGLTCIVLAFVLYARFGDIIPGILQARTQPFHDLISYITVDPVAMFGLPMSIVCMIVVAYVFLGQLLLKTGGSEWFTDIAAAMMGGTRGGSAKIAVVASGLYGSISGSAVSNVVSTGVITIPLMRQSGYEAKMAGAFEAVASTGGQIMPPIMGAAAFLMAEILQITYVEVVIAAIVPALLYYIAVFIYADLEAARNNIAPVPADQIPPLLRVLMEGWFFIIPFAVLVYALFSLNRSPEEAALWAAAALLIVNWIFGYKGRRIGPKGIVESITETGTTAVDIVVIGAMAGIIIGIVEISGLGFGLTFLLVQIGENNMPALLALTALVCIVLGMGMPTTAVYLLVATLAAPPLVQLGINPLAAHLYVFYFGIVSLITPPVCVAAYVAASLAKAGPMETAIASVRIGWTALVVPVMFVLSPNLIMQGEPLNVAIAFGTAIVGVWIVTIGVIGYFVRPLGMIMRFGFLVAGLGLLIPSQAFGGAILVEVCAGALAALLLSFEFMARRRQRVPI